MEIQWQFHARDLEETHILQIAFYDIPCCSYTILRPWNLIVQVTASCFTAFASRLVLREEIPQVFEKVVTESGP